jgi:hypothetical protein
MPTLKNVVKSSGPKNPAKDAILKLKLQTKGVDAKSALNLVKNSKLGIVSPRDPQSGLPTGKSKVWGDPHVQEKAKSVLGG